MTKRPLPPQQERDLMRVMIYAKILNINKENRRFVDAYGQPTRDYWAEARKIVEPKMREWIENEKDPFENQRSFLL